MANLITEIESHYTKWSLSEEKTKELSCQLGNVDLKIILVSPVGESIINRG